MNLEMPNALMLAAVLENRVVRMARLHMLTSRLSWLGAVNAAISALTRAVN